MKFNIIFSVLLVALSLALLNINTKLNTIIKKNEQLELVIEDKLESAVEEAKSESYEKLFPIIEVNYNSINELAAEIEGLK